MADGTMLFTGAGGFIGRYLLPHYIERGDRDLILIENGRFCERLKAFLDTSVKDEAKRARVRIVEGDITRPDLGLDAVAANDIKERATHAIHLAALYNLSAPRDVSMRVNVDGTRHVLDFLGGCKNLRRLGYMSTVAISGTHKGVFNEDDFDKGQSFKNYYEETKFLAEKEVRERRGAIPTVIFRPTIVVGHSQTGAIEKVDGPYYGLTMIARNLHFVGIDSGPVKCHIAPVDYVTDAICALFEDDDAAGGVYCLGDSNPLTYNAFFDLACEHWGKMKIMIKVPPALMKPFTHLPLFDTITGVTPEAFMYSIHPIDYTVTRATAALEKYGVRCPPVPSYIDVMLRYFKEHVHDPNVRRGKWWRSTT